jgi:hypothetical protein
MKYLAANRYPEFLRRMGTAAFVFFLVKGLLWLAAPLLFLWVA